MSDDAQTVLRPPSEALSAARLATVLPMIGAQEAVDLPSDQIAGAVSIARPATTESPPRWHFEDEVVVTSWDGKVGAAQDLYCSCGSYPCTHVAAVLVLVAWADESHRSLFTKPVWEVALTPFLAAAATSKAKSPHDGWVRYELILPDASKEIPAFPQVERSVIRLSRKNRQELTPQSVPRTMARLETRVSRISQADRDAHRCLAALQRVKRLSRKADAVAEVQESLYRQWFEAVSRAGDVRFQGQPLWISLEPLHPRLEVVERDQVGQLAWSPRILQIWRGGTGWILTADRELRPLSEGFPEALRSWLSASLPAVPLEDLPSFVEQYVASSRLSVPITLAGMEDAQAETREARLMLAEQASALEIAVRFAYCIGEEEGEVEARAPTTVVRVGERLIARDLSWESTCIASLRRALSVKKLDLPMHLRGDEALDFLTEHLDGLHQTFAVYGEKKLVRYRTSPPIEVSVRTPSEVDWFDIQVWFAAGGRAVSAQQILESWLQGRRYIRLSDGALARLPEQWLVRHGATLAEWEDMRRVLSGPLGLMALPLATEILQESGQPHTHWLTVAERLKQSITLQDREPPGTVNATLRDYQRVGFQWLATLRDLGLGCCLADDMGLGKTLQSLTLLADTHATSGAPSLVVAPTSVIANWAREAQKFVPSLRVVVHHGSKRDAKKWADADVVITSYGLLRVDDEDFQEATWQHVILDEAQKIKNASSQVSKAARALKASHRIALSGTPLENSVLELKSLFDFINPGFFGSRRAFLERYATPISQGDEVALDRLRHRVRPFLLRRLKREVAHELPPRQEVVLRCTLGAEQRALYERVRDTYRATVLGHVEQLGIGGATIHILEALTRLRQACCHPAMLPFDELEARQVPSAKLDLLLETLDNAIAGGHRSLIFSQWPSLLRIVRDALRKSNVQSLYLDGTTKDRQGLVDTFNADGGPPVFLISLKAGGTGLNLTGADHVFLLDPWWNPATEAQATDRAYRIGQTRPVMVYKLVAEHTVEEHILKLQERKRALFEATVESNRLVADRLTKGDLEALFGSVLGQGGETA